MNINVPKTREAGGDLRQRAGLSPDDRTQLSEDAGLSFNEDCWESEDEPSGQAQLNLGFILSAKIRAIPNDLEAG